MRTKLRGVSARALEQFAERARRAAGVRGEVNILVTGDRELQRLNREFRGHDNPTDVLSFLSPADHVAGDIAVSAETGATNARRLGHNLLEEIQILILHGMLHLAGYDHERDAGEMTRKEQNLRRRMGLPAALIERTDVQRTVPNRRRRKRA